jgi:anaerobic sulfite reductase subunit A
MGVRFAIDEFDNYLTMLSDKFEFYGPIRQEGKGRFSDTGCIGYGKVSSVKDIVVEEKSYYSPKEIFYPIRETLFYFLNDEMREAKIDTKPMVMFLRPCDINGIERLDTIFLENGKEKDYYYLRRRKLLKFIMIECTEGFDNCFCVSMGAHKTQNYEGVIRFEGTDILFDTQDGALLTDGIKAKEHVPFTPDFVKENKVKVTIPEPGRMTKETFNHPLWSEYTNRCVACGRCSTSCITCSCFSMQDVKVSDDQKMGERRRVWASCHIEGYTDMAGGHRFRQKNGEKMRFKTMHKVNDFYKRFGMHMCVGCGRCEDVCPEYISFSKCINKLNQVIQEESSHA